VPDCHFRPYAPSDYSKLHEIRNAAFAPVFASFRELVGDAIAPIAFAAAEEEQGALLDQLCVRESGGELHVMEVGDEVAGFVALAFDHHTGIGEIELNAIHPGHQGRGLGLKMYNHACARLKLAGMKIATVGTGGDPAHAPARRAYEKAGFSAGLPTVYLYKKL